MSNSLYVSLPNEKVSFFVHPFVLKPMQEDKWLYEGLSPQYLWL